MLVMVLPSSSTVRAWRESSRSFEDIEAYATTDMMLRGRDGAPTNDGSGGGATLVHEASILPSFLHFTGHHPLIGRAFTETDVNERAHVAMLSEALWRGRYGSDPTILGQSIRLDDSLYTVIGVMPDAVRLPRLLQDVTDIWLPLDLRTDIVGLTGIGRLRPGVTHAAAAAELDSISARAAAPATEKKGQQDFTTKLARPSEMVGFHDSLIMLTVAVALVLLIACANVAHLLVARAATREREMAVRAALGAGRTRLFRQLLTESLVLAAAGCVGGLAVGWLGLRALVAMRPESLSQLSAAHMDGATLLVTMVIAAGTGVVFGLAGAMHVSRHSTHEALKAGALSTSQGRRHRRLRSMLVVSEMALSATLLVGAVLLVRSIIHLQTLDPGFEPAGLYAVSVSMFGSTSKTAARSAFFHELETRARSVSGVQAATVASTAPPMRSFLIGALEIEGQTPPPPGMTSFINFNGVEPDFFRVMGIRLVEGTTFSDTSQAAGQVVINQGMARKYWPRESAIGHRIRMADAGGTEAWKTIVGVAADARTGGLTAESSEPMLYMPMRNGLNSSLIVRTTPGTQPLSTLRALAAQIDPSLPPASVTSIADAMTASIAGQRFTMFLLATFTVLALVLAAVGLYGVMAYGVAQRTREIGIRMALGASRSDVARSVVWQGLALTLAGAAIGLVAALWATKLVAKMLYGVAPTDAVSFIVGALVLLGAAVLACIVPVRRAVSVAPSIAMRAE
jgi:putative ABC transport system permease protein